MLGCMHSNPETLHAEPLCLSVLNRSCSHCYRSVEDGGQQHLSHFVNSKDGTSKKHVGTPQFPGIVHNGSPHQLRPHTTGFAQVFRDP